MTVPGFPNLFLMYGPNTNSASARSSTCWNRRPLRRRPVAHAASRPRAGRARRRRGPVRPAHPGAAAALGVDAVLELVPRRGRPHHEQLAGHGDLIPDEDQACGPSGLPRTRGRPVRRKLRSPLPQRHGLDAARCGCPTARGRRFTTTSSTGRRCRPSVSTRCSRRATSSARTGRSRPTRRSCRARFLVAPGPAGRGSRSPSGSCTHSRTSWSTSRTSCRPFPAAHVLQAALVRLRNELGLPELSAAHRLDRVTAGLVIFVIPRDAAAYQTLFRDRRVRKVYRAIARRPRPRRAAHRPQPHHQGTRDHHRVHRRRPAERRDPCRAARAPRRLGHYRLGPGPAGPTSCGAPGVLGVPILGDPFYPVLHDIALDDFRRPLQLLASELEFRDPITGEQHRFETRRSLQAWTSIEDWRSGVIE